MSGVEGERTDPAKVTGPTAETTRATAADKPASAQAGTDKPATGAVATEEAPDTAVEQAEDVAAGSARPGRGNRKRRRGLLPGNPTMVTIMALFTSALVGAVLIVISDQPSMNSLSYFFSYPWDFFGNAGYAITQGYTALFEGAIFNPITVSAGGGFNAALGPISETLVSATPLIAAGLAVALAFRAGLFNIGCQGQIIAGAIGAAWVGFAVHLPPGLHLIVALAAGIAGGALWGGIAGYLKARTGAHEVISTIMLNYVALYLLGYLLSVDSFQAPPFNQAISRTVDPTARLPHLLGSGLRVHLGLILALLAAVGVWWLMNRSTPGFELRAVGSNAFAARTSGMSVGNTYIKVMLAAGALSGLAGCAQAIGTNTSITGDVDGGFGFDAITVALLGRGKPGGTVAAGLLFGALRAGGVQMQSSTGTPVELVQVVQSIVVLFVAAPALIRALWRMRAGDTGLSQELAKGWNG